MGVAFLFFIAADAEKAVRKGVFIPTGRIFLAFIRRM